MVLDTSTKARLRSLASVQLDCARLALMPRQGLVDLGAEETETVWSHVAHVRDLAKDLGVLLGHTPREIDRTDACLRWHEMPEVITEDQPLVPREDRTVWEQIRWQREEWVPETRDEWAEKRACAYREEVIPATERLFVNYHPDDQEVIWNALCDFYTGTDRASVLGQEAHLVQPPLLAVQIAMSRAARRRRRFPAEDFIRRAEAVVEIPHLVFIVRDLSRRLRKIRTPQVSRSLALQRQTQSA